MGTLRQCLCAQDSLSFEQTACVDLSTLQWTEYSTGMFIANISSVMEGSGSNSVPGKILCSNYQNYSWNACVSPGIAVCDDANPMQIRDDTYANNLSGFTTHLKGILLAYKKKSS